MTGLVFLRFKRSLKLGALLVSVRWGIFVAFSHAPSLSPAYYDVEAPRCGLLPHSFPHSRVNENVGSNYVVGSPTQ